MSELRLDCSVGQCVGKDNMGPSQGARPVLHFQLSDAPFMCQLTVGSSSLSILLTQLICQGLAAGCQLVETGLKVSTLVAQLVAGACLMLQPAINFGASLTIIDCVTDCIMCLLSLSYPSISLLLCQYTTVLINHHHHQ